MPRLDPDPFLALLPKFFEQNKESGSVWMTMKRYRVQPAKVKKAGQDASRKRGTAAKPGAAKSAAGQQRPRRTKKAAAAASSSAAVSSSSSESSPAAATSTKPSTAKPPTAAAQTTKAESSSSSVARRRKNKPKPWVPADTPSGARSKDRKVTEPSEPMCLIRVTDGKHKMSTLVKAKDVPQFQKAYLSIYRGYMDSLQRSAAHVAKIKRRHE